MNSPYARLRGGILPKRALRVVWRRTSLRTLALIDIAPGSPSTKRLEFLILPRGPSPNVNKVSTAVQLRFDVAGSARLPETVRRRLAALAGRRLSRDGVLTITAQRHRSQERNRQDAIERLVALIAEAARPVKPRKPTRPSHGSRCGGWKPSSGEGRSSATAAASSIHMRNRCG